VQAYLDYMKAAVDAGMPPLKVADQVFEAIKEERFYILSHPEWLPVVKLRVDNLLQLKNPQNPDITIMDILQKGN